MPIHKSSPMLERIVQHLEKEGTDSISGIARFLSSDQDKPVHRLTVAGYLQAMAEMGVLHESEMPPCKTYGLNSSRIVLPQPHPEADSQ